MSGQQGDKHRDPRRARSEHRITVPRNPFSSQGALLCPGTGHISAGKPLLRQRSKCMRREQRWGCAPMGCLPQPAPILRLCRASFPCCKLTGTWGLTKPPLLPGAPASTQPCLRAAQSSCSTCHDTQQTPARWAGHGRQRPAHCPQHGVWATDGDEPAHGARCLSEHC